MNDLANIILAISFVCLLPILFRFGRNILEVDVRVFSDELKQIENQQKAPDRKLQDVRLDKAYLAEKLTQLSKLYTITKEMSSTMRFSELFKSLESFLEDNFQFGKVKIALFKKENNGKIIDRIYEINPVPGKSRKKDEILERMANSIVKSKKPLFLQENEDLFSFGFPPELKNILAVPLIVHRRVIAGLLVENTHRKDYDKFLILAPQIAVQIERISLFESVERLSIRDGLTGVFLRRYFLERLEEEIGRAKQCRMDISLITADLDHFKSCNDNYGHLVGDIVLKKVASILERNVREIDLVGRFGGEEFCIFLPETNKAGAHAVAERIRNAIENHAIEAYDESVRTTISIGVSSFPEDSSDMEELIENADRALYEAKKQGRNRTCLA